MQCMFLREVVPVLPDNMALAAHHDMWFWHSGSSTHLEYGPYSIRTHFPGTWIECHGPAS